MGDISSEMPFCSLPETQAPFSAHLRQKKAGGDTEGEEYRLDDLVGGESKEELKRGYG